MVGQERRRDGAAGRGVAAEGRSGVEGGAVAAEHAVQVLDVGYVERLRRELRFLDEEVRHVRGASEGRRVERNGIRRTVKHRWRLLLLLRERFGETGVVWHRLLLLLLLLLARHGEWRVHLVVVSLQTLLIQCREGVRLVNGGGGGTEVPGGSAESVESRLFFVLYVIDDEPGVHFSVRSPTKVKAISTDEEQRFIHDQVLFQISRAAPTRRTVCCHRVIAVVKSSAEPSTFTRFAANSPQSATERAA